MMSSKKVPTNFRCSLKILSIILLKVVGALVNPNGKSKGSPECGFVHILRPNPYLMIATLQNNATEDDRTLQPIQYVINVRYGEPIFYGDLIEGSVVNTHSLGSILLVHQKLG